jgi:glycopeptide antibiotics resistance protein
MNALTRRRHAVLRRLAWFVGAVYLVTLGFIALWPTPVDRAAAGTITKVLAKLHAVGVPGWFDYELVEFTANVVLFLPVGLLGVVLLGASRWWAVVLIGFSISCGIELSQLAFLPARYATLQDVLANSSGAVIGAMLGTLLLAMLTSRDRPERMPVA